MFKIIKKQTRQDVNIPFYFEITTTSDEYKLHMKVNYIDTRKLLNFSQEFSSDKLEVTSIASWATQKDFLDYLTDRFCYTSMLIPNDVYNLDNDIESEITVEGN